MGLTGHLRLDSALGNRGTLCSSMPNTPKVIAFDRSRSRVIAVDEKTHRVIVAIGRQRFAFDVSTRVTELPPDVGDRPGKILPLIRYRKKPKS